MSKLKKVVLILGSQKDATHALKITSKLKELEIAHETHISSAHKSTRETLILLENLENEKQIVIVTIAGMSNALSGVCAANSRHPIVACPPFSDKIDFLVNINSTLQMPSNVPVLTILNPENCALACERILNIKIF
jgi:5-(carboxyamino)imidazole ribonucleotide mutase